MGNGLSVTYALDAAKTRHAQAESRWRVRRPVEFRHSVGAMPHYPRFRFNVVAETCFKVGNCNMRL
jgi:hypothetical protein